jgi:hypothetical protein
MMKRGEKTKKKRALMISLIIIKKRPTVPKAIISPLCYNTVYPMRRFNIFIILTHIAGGGLGTLSIL